MNILHINSERSWRGGELQLTYLIKEFEKVEKVNTYVMGRSGSKLQSWCEERGVHFKEAPLRGGADVLTGFKIKQFCKQHKIDVVHAHTSHAHSAMLYAGLMGVSAKMVLHRRVSFPVKDRWLARLKYRSKMINAIICISKDVKRVLEETLSDDQRLVLIYDSINSSRFKSVVYKDTFRERYQLPSSKYIVVNTSAISSEKDYKTFVDTADLVLKSPLDVVFLIVGDGSERGSIEDYVVEKNLSKSVYFLGFVEDVSDVFKHASLLLITSKIEGLGTAILEAFHHRVPVVATSAGGIPEIVRHEKTGMLASIASSKEAATHVEAVLEQPQLSSLLTENGYRLVSEEFKSPRMAAETLALYEKILSESQVSDRSADD